MKRPLEDYNAKQATMFELLNLSGQERTRAVHALALDWHIHPSTVYRWLSQARKANGLGRRRLPRSDRGQRTRKEEAAHILAYKRQHPDASAIQIQQATGCRYSIASINRILRADTKKAPGISRGQNQ